MRDNRARPLVSRSPGPSEWMEEHKRRRTEFAQCPDPHHIGTRREADPQSPPADRRTRAVERPNQVHRDGTQDRSPGGNQARSLGGNQDRVRSLDGCRGRVRSWDAWRGLHGTAGPSAAAARHLPNRQMKKLQARRQVPFQSLCARNPPQLGDTVSSAATIPRLSVLASRHYFFSA